MARREHDMDFEIRFYERILTDKPDFIEALIALGDLYTKRGCYEKGLDVDRKLSRLRSEDPVVLYNLACSYSLLSDVDKAFSVIKLALQCGYDDFDYLEQDTDLLNLRSSPAFQQYFTQFRKENPTQVKRDRLT